MAAAMTNGAYGFVKVVPPKRRHGMSTAACGFCGHNWKFPEEKEVLAHARRHVAAGDAEELPGPRFKPVMK